MAQNRLTAVGRVDASSAQMMSTLSLIHIYLNGVGHRIWRGYNQGRRGRGPKRRLECRIGEDFQCDSVLFLNALRVFSQVKTEQTKLAFGNAPCGVNAVLGVILRHVSSRDQIQILRIVVSRVVGSKL